MSGRLLSILGAAARTARRVGLGRVLATARDGVDRLFLGIRRPPLRAVVHGVEIRGFLRHRSFLAEAAHGYEDRLTELLVAAAPPGATVVDGGAHIGLHTIMASRLVGPTGRVFAFEPDPYNYAALRANLARSGCTNVAASPKALGAAPRRATLHQSLGTISTSLSAREPKYGPFRQLQVEITSLDHELADAPDGPLVVKLDLEGSEPGALDGMTSLAGRAQLVCIVEVNPEALACAGSTPADVIERLRALGLEPCWIEEGSRTLAAVGMGSPSRKGNLYATKG